VAAQQPRPLFYGSVRDGKLLLNKKDLDNVLKPLESKRVIVYVSSVEGDFTDAQRAYYYANIGELSRQTGNSKEELHDKHKKLFLDEVKPGALSTSELSVAQFAEFIELSAQWDAETFDFAWTEASHDNR
jgi:hypothetical protein